MNQFFKKCLQCEIEQDINNFGKKYKRKICNSCRSYNRRINYQNNKEKILAQNKEWVLNNLDKKKKIDKEYYQKNKEKILLRNKDPKILLRNRLNKIKWTSLNKDKIKNYPSYKKKKFYYLKSVKKRLRSNYIFKLRTTISKSIRKLLKTQKISKNNISILKYLPYSIEELKFHLEKQFESWMNWNNWGIYRLKTWDDNNQSTWTWQIDHIIPQSKLIYSSMEDENFKKCWSLENLRPLSSKENLLKSNK